MGRTLVITVTSIFIMLAHVGMGYAEPNVSEAVVDHATREVDRNFEQEAEQEMLQKPSTPLIKIDNEEEWRKEQQRGSEDGTVIETVPKEQVGEPYLE